MAGCGQNVDLISYNSLHCTNKAVGSAQTRGIVKTKSQNLQNAASVAPGLLQP